MNFARKHDAEIEMLIRVIVHCLFVYIFVFASQGAFKDGLFHGEGVLKVPNGIKYEGYFHEGVAQGKFDQRQSHARTHTNRHQGSMIYQPGRNSTAATVHTSAARISILFFF